MPPPNPLDGRQARASLQPGTEVRPGSVSAPPPSPDGGWGDAERLCRGVHAGPFLWRRWLADQPARVGGLRARTGVVTEESDHCRQGPETGGGGSGLPMEDRRLVDTNPQRNLPLEESEVQAARSNVIAD